MSDLAIEWRRLPFENKNFVYQINRDGKIIKTSKKMFRESRVKPYNKCGKLAVKIAGKEYHVKHLVAMAYISDYRKGDSVVLKDGNYKNCKLGNLIIFTKSELGKITGGDSRRKPVMANGVEYYSVRDCAKSLNCSYQTLSDYLSGKVKNSVLAGNAIKYMAQTGAE
jgi:hypothetical protein